MSDLIKESATCADPSRRRRSTALPGSGPTAWIVVVVVVVYAALTFSGVPQEPALAGVAGAAAIGVRAAVSVSAALKVAIGDA